jgi:syntaxin 16
VLKEQQPLLQQREMDKDGQGSIMQKPVLMDYNLMKLIDVTGGYMNGKSRILERVEEVVANESNAVQKMVRNLKRNEETKLWDQDRQYLEVKQSLKQTKDMMDRLDQEDVVRLKRVLENTEKINQTYKKMNMVVVQQGQVLDRVDYNLNLAVTYTRKANAELKKLYDSYNSTAFGLQVGLLVAIVVLSLMLLFKWTR